MAWSKKKQIAATLTSVLLGISMSVSAEKFPEQPIKIIVPYSAGGSTDIAARILAEGMSKQLGQPIIVDNKPGAGGTIGTMASLRSEADGYTILITSSSHLVNKILQPELQYDIQKDFAPLSQITRVSIVLVVRGDYPVNDVQSLIKRGKEGSTPLTYGTAGNGTIQHVSASQFTSLAGIEATHVPYKGGAAAVTDVIGGRVDFTFAPLVEVISHLQSGRLKALAVSTRNRSFAIPEVPSLSETLKKYESFHWNGFVVKTGTPADRIQKLAKAVTDATRDEVVVEKLRAQGTDAVGNGPTDLTALMRSEQQRLEPMLKATTIKRD